MKRLIVALMVCGSAVAAAAQIRIPNLPLPKDLPLPNLDGLLRGGSPISTTMKDARGEVPFLDHLDPRPGDLASLRNNTGTFTLKPGYWAMELQSFCFRPGTRGPRRTDGRGYLYGQIAGPDSAIFVDMLSKYSTLRNVDQRDMQVLIWALLSRTKIRNMNPEMQALAVRVLTPVQIAALDSGALDVVPPDMRRRAFDALPAEVRAIADAENRIRDVMYRANYSYRELERIAVIDSPEPKSGRQIPRQRWSVHPNGYLIRFKPNSYASTRVEIAVPPRVTIRRDSRGRIASIDFGDGRRTETEYDDSIPAWDPSPNLLAVGYAFKTIRMTMPGPNGRSKEVVLRNKGWTWVTRRATRLSRQHVMFALFRQPSLGERFDAWKERYDQWNEEFQERLDYYRERWERNTEPPPSTDDAIRDLEDSEHYRDGLDAALRGDTGDRLEWIIDNQERQNRALESATVLIWTLPTESTTDDTPEYVPPRDIAIPACPDCQRLGFAGR
jgi:hypothetical protein